MEDWFPQLSRRRDGPWLAHRLDADTSGCLLIALRKTALREAQALFASGQVAKVYWAVVHGRPDAESGRIERNLSKRTGPAGWRMVQDPAGQPAITDWRLLGTDGARSWLELRPKTGRTHQIRVHCAGLGCAIVGDPLYGADAPNERLHLLARSLHVPVTPSVSAVAPVPEHMKARPGALPLDPAGDSGVPMGEGAGRAPGLAFTPTAPDGCRETP